MKTFIALTAGLLMSTPAFAAVNNPLKSKICNVFATEMVTADYDDGKSYRYENVYNYCVNHINPKKISDNGNVYYQFSIFVCGNVYQDTVMAYFPETQELEDLGGSGTGQQCPY